jgi:hypothetical protein
MQVEIRRSLVGLKKRRSKGANMSRTDFENLHVYQRHRQETRWGLEKGEAVAPQPTGNRPLATYDSQRPQTLGDTELSSGEDL